MTEEEQEDYHSGLGMNMYLVKHSRPELANPVRELSNKMQQGNYADQKNLHRLIKFVLDTEKAKLKMIPGKKFGRWELKSICDAGFATDPDTRRSVTGYFVFFNGVLVSWKSKLQKNVTLSSTEGDYVSTSHVRG